MPRENSEYPVQNPVVFAPNNTTDLTSKLRELWDRKKLIDHLVISDDGELLSKLKQLLTAPAQAPFSRLIINGAAKLDETLLIALSNADVGVIEFQNFAEADIDKLIKIVKEQQLTCQIKLPPDLNKAKQLELDDLVSTNRRNQSIAQFEKTWTPAKTGQNQEGITDKKRTRDRTMKLSAGVDQEMQQDNEQQVQVTVSNAAEAEQALTTDDKKKIPIVLTRSDFLAKQLGSAQKWDVWFGNIHQRVIATKANAAPILSWDLQATKHDLTNTKDIESSKPTDGTEVLVENRAIKGMSPEALAEINQNLAQFEFGLDFNNLPPGFILLSLPTEGGENEENTLLHFDKHIKSESKRQPMAVPTNFRGNLPHVMSAPLFALWLAKQDKTPEEQELQKEYTAMIQSGYSQERLVEIKGKALKAVGNLSRDQALIYDALKTSPNADALTKKIHDFQEQFGLKSTELNSLLKVWDEKGEKALTQVMKRYEDFEDTALLNNLLNLNQPVDYNVLLDDITYGQMKYIQDLPANERAWWDKLYQGHSANVGQDDIVTLIQDFQSFKSQIEEYSKKLGIPALTLYENPGFTDIKNMRVAMSRMLTILKKCDISDIQEQWKGITQLDLQSNGAIRHLNEVTEQKEQIKFVVPEMQATPTAYNINHDAGSGKAPTGYTSISVNGMRDTFYAQSGSVNDSYFKSVSNIYKSATYYENSWDTPEDLAKRKAASFATPFEVMMASSNQSELERNYYRLLSSEAISLPLSFYQEASALIQQAKFGGNENDEFEMKCILQAIVIKGTCGLENRALISSEKKAIETLKKMFAELKGWDLGFVLGFAKGKILADLILQSSDLLEYIPFSEYDQFFKIILNMNKCTLTDAIKDNPVIMERMQRMESLMSNIGLLNNVRGVASIFNGFNAAGLTAPSKNEKELDEKFKKLEDYVDQACVISNDKTLPVAVRRNLLVIIGSFKFLDSKPTLHETMIKTYSDLPANKARVVETSIKLMAKMKSTATMQLDVAKFNAIIADLLTNDPSLEAADKLVIDYMEKNYKDNFDANFFEGLKVPELSPEIISQINAQFSNSNDQKLMRGILEQFTDPLDKMKFGGLVTQIKTLDDILKKTNKDNDCLSVLKQIPLQGKSVEQMTALLQAIGDQKNLDGLIIFLDAAKTSNTTDLLEKSTAFMTVGMKAFQGMVQKNLPRVESLALIGRLIHAGISTEISLNSACEAVSTVIKQHPSDRGLIYRLLNDVAEDLGKQPNGNVQLASFIDNLAKICDKLPQETLRALASHHLDSDKKGADAFDFPTLLQEIHSKTVDSETTVTLLTIISNLKNNKIAVSKEERQQMITLCSDNKDFLNIANACYQKAPYPPISEILAWHNEAKSKNLQGAEYATAIQNAYDAFTTKPCDREPDNGFKMSEATDILTALGENSLLGKKDLEQLERDIASVKQEKISDLRDKIKPPNTLTDTMRVAILAELLHRSKGMNGGMGKSFELNTTQYIAVLHFAINKTHLTQDIATGEGKSRIQMMGCALRYSEGFTVDFVTSNPQLALRDYVEYKSYFTSIGAKPQYITASSPISDYKISGGIHFSDAPNLSLFRNQAFSQGRGSEVFAEKSLRALLLDEADQTYYDSVNTRYNFSMASSEALSKMTWVYPLLNEFMSDPKNVDLFYDDVDECDSQFRLFVAGRCGNEPDKIDQLNDISNEQLETWHESALIALGLKLTEDFSIDPNVLTKTSSGPKMTSEARLVQNSRVITDAKFSLGVHQCLHARLNKALENPESEESKFCKDLVGNEEPIRAFDISPEKQIVYSSTSKTFLDDYQEGSISAVTGSTGAEIERLEAGKFYGMKFVEIPRHNEFKRKDLPFAMTKDASARYQRLLEEVNDAQKNNRPVLILAESDQDCKNINDYFKAHGHKNANLLLSNSTSDREAKVIKEGGNPNQITISNSRLGRGADIGLSKAYKELIDKAKQSGLATRVAFIPTLRELVQMFGRSGRFGAEGDARMIVDRDQVKQFIGSNNIPNSLYTTGHSFIHLQQLKHSRKDQSTRLLAFVISDYRDQFTATFFNQLENVPPGKARDELLIKWSDFLKDIDQEWPKYAQKVLKDVNDSPDYLTMTKSNLKAFHQFAEKRWEARELPPELIGKIKPIAISQDTFEIYKLKADEMNQKLEQPIHSKFDKALAGRAAIFNTPFAETRAMLKGERKIFANTRAALSGEGLLFANTMALLTGNRPLFANLRAWITNYRSLNRIDARIDKLQGEIQQAMEKFNQEVESKRPVSLLMNTNLQALKEKSSEMVSLLKQKTQLQTGPNKEETEAKRSVWQELRKIIFVEKPSIDAQKVPTGALSMIEEKFVANLETVQKNQKVCPTQAVSNTLGMKDAMKTGRVEVTEHAKTAEVDDGVALADLPVVQLDTKFPEKKDCVVTAAKAELQAEKDKAAVEDPKSPVSNASVKL